MISALENSKSAMVACGKLIISVCYGVMSESAQGLRDSEKINSNCFQETIFNDSILQRISQRHPLLFSNHNGNIFLGAHSLRVQVQHFLNRHGFKSQHNILGFNPILG